MAAAEQEQTRSLAEKMLWWGEYGGIVVAAIGLVRHWANWAIGGGLIFAVSEGLRRRISSKRQQVAGA